MDKRYYIYILTNPNRTTLYIGMTNNLTRRLNEHYENKDLNSKTFTGKYNCYHLIYFEEYLSPNDAIQREKEIKKWSRKKKEDLIATLNPEWNFLLPP